MTDVKHHLTTAEVAALFRVTQRTVRRWANSGRIPHTRTPGRAVRRGDYRYPATEIGRLVEQSEFAAVDP